jgi:hypothetical protein
LAPARFCAEVSRALPGETRGRPTGSPQLQVRDSLLGQRSPSRLLPSNRLPPNLASSRFYWRLARPPILLRRHPWRFPRIPSPDPAPAADPAPAQVATVTASAATFVPSIPVTQADSPGGTRFGRFTQRQWMLGPALGSGWLIVLAALLVLGVRWFLDLESCGTS